ncbi:DUF998 domain-containing protein [Thermosipho ferrireducens]|uniref:DUF998 domain-containing protein n=1 Tax=Thermosipho ferrireducens TaxID=2571116 RepID=A0ABX7S8W9_9BACT|nr:DUF998 domain-containing protein [Thermosipho ferrireducens]QTA38275.1 DUF998 domain-containing protein [Thermosipho ferrireducens]
MKSLKFLGLLSITMFFVGVFISVYFNEWFNLSQYTFSKLGNSYLATYPWIFSFFVIVGGVFMTFYGLVLIRKSIEKLRIIGGAYVLLSGIFMILVGVFPDGTKPHDFVALMTFLIFYAGMMVYGFKSSDKVFQVSSVAIFITIIIVLVYNPFPSTGYLEIFGLLLVVIDLILEFFEGKLDRLFKSFL